MEIITFKLCVRKRYKHKHNSCENNTDKRIIFSFDKKFMFLFTVRDICVKKDSTHTMPHFCYLRNNISVTDVIDKKFFKNAISCYYSYLTIPYLPRKI